MYTMPLGSASWDIKPQFALSFKAIEDGDYATDGDASGSAFILGNSFVFGDGGRGLTWSIDVDYRMGKIKEFDGVDLSEDLDLNNLMIGLVYFTNTLIKKKVESSL